MFTVAGALALSSWADGPREALFSHLESMPAETFTKTVTGFGIPTIRDILLHMVELECVWRDSVLGASPPNRLPRERPATLEDVRALYEENVTLTRLFLQQLTDQEFSSPRVVSFPWDGSRHRVSPAWVFMHLLTHEFHHRGQVAAMCRSLGSPAKNLELALPATVGSM